MVILETGNLTIAPLLWALSAGAVGFFLCVFGLVNFHAYPVATHKR